jgi:hypothetical protein
MFWMSVKSVPGCLVLIAPSLIGVPVAGVPGFGPQDDVSVEPLVEAAVLVVDVAEVDEAAGAAALLVLLLLLLLPQPAMNSTPRTATNDRPSRTRGKSWYILTDLLLLEDCVCNPPQGFGERGDTNAWPSCMQ